MTIVTKTITKKNYRMITITKTKLKLLTSLSKTITKVITLHVMYYY